MVVHKAKVLKIDPVYGEGHEIIEEWAVFELDYIKIAAFLGISVLYPSDIGKEYYVNFKLMTHDIYRINIGEKMLKQISTFPKMPEYYILGKIKSVDIVRRKIVVDCGLDIECDVSGIKNDGIVRCLSEGMWVFIYGSMYGDIKNG